MRPYASGYTMSRDTDRIRTRAPPFSCLEKPANLQRCHSVNRLTRSPFSRRAQIFREIPLVLSLYLSIYTHSSSIVYVSNYTYDRSFLPPSNRDNNERDSPLNLSIELVISSLVFESTRIVVASSSRLSHLLSLPPLLFGLPVQLLGV